MDSFTFLNETRVSSAAKSAMVQPLTESLKFNLPDLDSTQSAEDLSDFEEREDDLSDFGEREDDLSDTESFVPLAGIDVSVDDLGEREDDLGEREDDLGEREDDLGEREDDLSDTESLTPLTEALTDVNPLVELGRVAEIKEACRRDMLLLFFYMVGMVTAPDMMDTVSPTTVAVGDKRHRTSYLDPPWEQWDEEKVSMEPCVKKRRQYRRRQILKRERYRCIECYESFSDQRRLRAHYQREHNTHGEPFHRSRFCYEDLRGNSNAFTFVCRLCFETTKCYDPRCCNHEARERLLAGETVNLDEYTIGTTVVERYGTVCWHGCEVWGYHPPGATHCKRAMRPNVHMFENLAHLKAHVNHTRRKRDDIDSKYHGLHAQGKEFDVCIHQMVGVNLFSYFEDKYGKIGTIRGAKWLFQDTEQRLARFGIDKDSKIWNDMMLPNTRALTPEWTKQLKTNCNAHTCPWHIFKKTFGQHTYLPLKHTNQITKV